MMNDEFDPFDILEQHEEMINQLITAHNTVAKLQEELSVSVVRLDQKIDKIQRLILRNLDEAK